EPRKSPRSPADHVRADRALLSTLQGPGKGQMGHYRQVARRDRRRKTRTRGDSPKRRKRRGTSGGHAVYQPAPDRRQRRNDDEDREPAVAPNLGFWDQVGMLVASVDVRLSG